MRPLSANPPGPASGSPSGSTTDKADARRRQILEAARACVLQAGFHGSSIHEIAQAAGLSVGQIYRYFDNKEAIIAALASQDIADMRERFALDTARGPLKDALIAQCSDAVDRSVRADRATVFLEVVAEAARNPKVLAIVQAADADERAMHQTMLRLACPPDVTDAEVEIRAEVLAALFDGLAMRAVIRPLEGSDHPGREALYRGLKPVLGALLSGPSAATHNSSKASED